VHLVEMFLPELIDGTEYRVAFDFPQSFGILEADLHFIRLADAIRNEVTNGKLGGAEAVVDGTRYWNLLPGFGRLDDFGLGSAEREIQVPHISEGTSFPVFFVEFRSRELLDLLNDDFLHNVHQAVADIGGMDNFVAEAVNDFALLVHHVVEFQRAFALLE